MVNTDGQTVCASLTTLASYPRTGPYDRHILDISVTYEQFSGCE